MTSHQTTPAALPADWATACPFTDPVQCGECGAIMERATADDSCRRTLRESFDQPEEWILVCPEPECEMDEPTYDTPDGCDHCDAADRRACWREHGRGMREPR